MHDPKYQDYNDKLPEEYKLNANADFNAATFDTDASERAIVPGERGAHPRHEFLPTIKGMSTYYS